MDPEPLVRAIVSAMLLLEHANEDEIEPGTAQQGLERIGRQLLQLGESDRVEFVAILERLAAGATADWEARFVRSIPYAIGMSDQAPADP